MPVVAAAGHSNRRFHKTSISLRFDSDAVRVRAILGADFLDAVTALFFALGFPALLFGAELLVRAASSLAASFGISPLVIGVTVVAYGTSAPEAAVSIQAITADPAQPDIAIGNVIGSNIANVLLVLGVSAILLPISISRTVLRRGLPQVIAVSMLVFLIALDGSISRIEGMLLLIGAVLFTIGVVYRGRTEPPEKPDTEDVSPPRLPSWLQVSRDLFLILIGLVMMVVAARWLVNGATAAARSLGVSELVIGLSIVAIGTSLPEVATSIVATLRGKRDIAVGNILGSNMFNLLLVLGLCATISPEAEGLRIEARALWLDLPVMIGVVVLCWPIFYTGRMISRLEGMALFGFYVCYMLFRFLQESSNPVTQVFGLVILFAIIPATILLLSHRIYKEWRMSQLETESKSHNE